MELYNQLFLQALKASLKGEKVHWDKEITNDEWIALMNQAQVHNVLALIYEAVYSCPAVKKLDAQLLERYRKKMLFQVMQQTMKTQEFLQLQKKLRNAGLTPIVVKGIVCRNLYPKPDYRISADEDVLIPLEQFSECHQEMLDYGMHLMKKDSDLDNDYEVSYRKEDNPIYIELHRFLFSTESEAYSEWNEYFKDVFKHITYEKIEDVDVCTMNYTDHLFYLICHSFKHFLHSGFGIRQVCDIVLFANTYGNKIDWKKILHCCTEIHAEKFTAAIFKIGEKYLTFQPEKACYPTQFRNIKIDETNLLEELLTSGVYGNSSMSRMHSSNMTLNAMASHKKGEKPKGNVLRLVFPKVKSLKNRYTYLEKRPYLLPVAWVDRLLKYRNETIQLKDNNAAESIRIGNQRIELLKQYGIISER